METFLNTFMPIIVGGGFISFLFYEIFNTKGREKKKEKKKSILYNANVTEKGVPAREVFETLKKNDLI